MSDFKNIIIFVFSMIVVSCNDDDTSIIDTNAMAEDLIGTWNLTEESQNGKVTTELIVGIPVSGIVTSVGKNLNAQFIFNENPNIYEASGGYTDVIKIAVAGQTLAEGDLEVPISSLIDQGSWSLNQGVLTLSHNGIEQTVNIIELTTTTLIIELDIEEDNITYQGFTGDIESTIKMTFEKQ
jgi:hypothetical protein